MSGWVEGGGKVGQGLSESGWVDGRVRLDRWMRVGRWMGESG